MVRASSGVVAPRRVGVRVGAVGIIICHHQGELPKFLMWMNAAMLP